MQINPVFNDVSRWGKAGLIASGIALTFLGMISIWGSLGTTLLSVLVVGVFLLFSSLFQFTFAFTSGRWSGFALHIILSIFHGILGLYLIINPMIGAVALTFVLGFFFVSSGLLRIVTSATVRFPQWGWACFSGVITTFMGFYTIFYLSQVSLFLLGTLIGIDFMFLGFYFMAAGFSLRGSAN